MRFEDIEKAATPLEIAAALEQNKTILRLLRHQHPQEPSVREEVYRGYQIRVVTTYEIFIDDQPVTGHLNLGNDGTVHYHAIPNEKFPSMIGMVRRIIDASIDLGTLASGGR